MIHMSYIRVFSVLLMVAAGGCTSDPPVPTPDNGRIAAAQRSDFSSQWVEEGAAVAVTGASLDGATLEYEMSSPTLRGRMLFRVLGRQEMGDREFYELSGESWGEAKEADSGVWRPLERMEGRTLRLGVSDGEVIEVTDGRWQQLNWAQADKVLVPSYPWMRRIRPDKDVSGSHYVEGLGIAKARDVKYRVARQTVFLGRRAMIVEKTATDSESGDVVGRKEFSIDEKTRVMIRRRSFDALGGVVAEDVLVATNLFELR